MRSIRFYWLRLYIAFLHFFQRWDRTTLPIEFNRTRWRWNPVNFVRQRHGADIYYFELNAFWLLCYAVELANINELGGELAFRDLFLADDLESEGLQMLLGVSLVYVAERGLSVYFIILRLKYDVHLIFRILQQAALIWKHLQYLRHHV